MSLRELPLSGSEIKGIPFLSLLSIFSIGRTTLSAVETAVAVGAVEEGVRGRVRGRPRGPGSRSR